MASSSSNLDPRKVEYGPDKVLKVACIGGGQLGRMMALEAPRLGVEMFFLDPSGASCPAAQVVPSSNIVTGSLRDAAAIEKLCSTSKCDVLTVEIEHVGVETLAELEKDVNIQPSSRVIGIIRDKLIQKEHFEKHSIPLPPFVGTPTTQSIVDAAKTLGLPIMLKSRKGGYDGRGNAVLNSVAPEDIAMALEKLGVGKEEESFDLYAEGWIDFVCEVAVMVVRSSNNTDIATYPAVNAIQQDSICRIVISPARSVSDEVRKQCEQVALNAIDSLKEGAAGMFGVELFVVRKPNASSKAEEFDVLLNEIAPRPHNTGHYTQDACVTNQFENHLRAVCGFPLGPTKLKVREAAMVNILGAKSGTMHDTLKSSNAALQMDNTSVHWYGKKECRAGRKMGHINIVDSEKQRLDASLVQLCELENIPLSLLPDQVTSSASSASSPNAVVGVIMGSQSDLPTMNAAIDMLKKFKVPYEVDIVSAHRTPNKLMEYSRGASGRGLKVIIAGAGGAAHLPGMVASMTPLPVIGVPVKTSTLSGVDSLYSIVQMPRGIPVATVAIGNAQNAGLLAIRILATSTTDFPNLRKDMENYQTELTDMVDEMSTRLQTLGSDEFLQQMDNKNKAVNV